jgi:uncharacterized protein YndB with AHSA1/START domain
LGVAVVVFSKAEARVPDILQDFPIRADANRVFEAITSPGGLDRWWTVRSAGEPVDGGEYKLWFGPEYDWRAKVISAVRPSRFELEMVAADQDWLGTRVGFDLHPNGESTQVRFHHSGWPQVNEHYRISCHCWAMYLRILRRYLEHGEVVPYEERLDV